MPVWHVGVSMLLPLLSTRERIDLHSHCLHIPAHGYCGAYGYTDEQRGAGRNLRCSKKLISILIEIEPFLNCAIWFLVLRRSLISIYIVLNYLQYIILKKKGGLIYISTHKMIPWIYVFSQQFPSHAHICEFLGAGPGCEKQIGYSAVYRLGFAVTVFHIIMMLITCGRNYYNVSINSFVNPPKNNSHQVFHDEFSSLLSLNTDFILQE